MSKGNNPRIVQLSDIHLFSDPTTELLGVNTNESFAAVANLLMQEIGKADAVILSGDISQDGSRASYERVAEIMKTIPLPVYCFPGNHDDVDTMMEVFPRDNILMNRHIVFPTWHLILLNSQKRGATEGHLDAAQLNYLEHCLQMHPERYAVIMFHHQPVSMGSLWLDGLGLNNADEFWQVVSHFPSVKAVLFGHVHQDQQQRVNGVLCYSAPSTCFQFMPKQDDFALEYLPPGYRVATLFADGRIETKVMRTHMYVGQFDPDAKGY